MGEQAAEWDTKTELQAATVDLLQILVRLQSEDPPEFKPVPRPYEVEKPKADTKGLDSLQGFLKGM